MKGIMGFVQVVSPTEVRVTRGQKPSTVPRLFTSYCKLLKDCFKYLLNTKRRKRMLNFFWNTWKSWWNETDEEIYFACTLHKISELWNLFSLGPMGNCFRCYCMQLLMYLVLRKCKNDSKTLTVILVPDFCPNSRLDFLSDFVLSFKSLESNVVSITLL